MCCCKDNCIVTAEVLTNAAQISLPLGVNERIQNNTLTSIMVPRSGSSTLKSASGKTVAADTVLATAHLVLKDSNGKEIVTIPLWHLMRDYNSPEPLRGEWIGVDVTQSYIILDLTAATTTQVIEITFGYNCKLC